MREWELSYRLGVRKDFKTVIWSEIYANARPAGYFRSRNENPRESGELSRKGQKNFSLPESSKFLEIIQKRKERRDIYIEFMMKMIEKQKRYRKIELDDEYVPGLKNEGQGQTRTYFQDTKTSKLLYLEKHRFVPGHEGGTYQKENVLLVTFAEHTMAHYLRYLQYGKVEDLRAYKIMLSDSNEQIRREKARLAGSFGGKKQQELLKQQNLGWYNSAGQKTRGLKGIKTARERRVGAFDPQNLIEANKMWQEKYEKDLGFREKMRKNLFLGNLQKFGIVVCYSKNDPPEMKSVRYNAPYESVSLTKGVEYTEARVHMSEDFFWYHFKFAERPGRSYTCHL